MKVCTDACLFGAWVADLISGMATGFTNPLRLNTILDIGSGTGLLTLMLAQKLNARIDGVEIDEKACTQANENVERSLWKNRITMFCADIKKFSTNTTYDLVLCNPPFYENSLPSPDAGINLARHESGLKLEELATKATELLADSGLLAVLLPYTRLTDLLKIAAANELHLIKQVNVKQTNRHSYFRVMLLFGRKHSSAVTQVDFNIRNDGAYSTEFTALLKDYYLYL